MKVSKSFSTYRSQMLNLVSHRMISHLLYQRPRLSESTFAGGQNIIKNLKNIKKWRKVNLSWRSHLRNVAESAASKGPRCSRPAACRRGYGGGSNPRRGLRCYDPSLLWCNIQGFWQYFYKVKFFNWQRMSRSCSVPTTLSATWARTSCHTCGIVLERATLTGKMSLSVLSKCGSVKSPSFFSQFNQVNLAYTISSAAVFSLTPVLLLPTIGYAGVMVLGTALRDQFWNINSS